MHSQVPPGARQHAHKALPFPPPVRGRSQARTCHGQTQFGPAKQPQPIRQVKAIGPPGTPACFGSVPEWASWPAVHKHVTSRLPLLPPPLARFLTTGRITSGLGEIPDPTRLPAIPTFTLGTGSTTGSDILAALTNGQPPLSDSQPAGGDTAPPSSPHSLHTMGPYNPAATIPPKVVKKILSLEFVEMAELRADIWPEDSATTDSANTPRRPRKPVTDIRVWLECFARMAAILTIRFPEKAPELWAYQTTILHAAHSYEGANWVAYDRLFRREMLAKRDLNWSVPSPRLYSEAFTGRAKRHPQCPHCLSEDHTGMSCPHNPNPPMVGWFHGPTQFQLGSVAPQAQPITGPQLRQAGNQEVCRNFNGNRCRFTRCRYLHICSECSGPHAALHCPQRLMSGSHGAPLRGRTTFQARSNRSRPYLTGPNESSEQS